MKHEIRLFGGLRQYAEETTIVAEGVTVGDALAWLAEKNPELVRAILDNGNLRPYVRVTVNGHDVALAQGLDTPLNEGDRVAIFPPITGG